LIIMPPSIRLRMKATDTVEMWPQLQVTPTAGAWVRSSTLAE
jgi:hypothetical protein